MKGNEALREWIPAVRNHFWHCAESCNGDEYIMKVWISYVRMYLKMRCFVIPARGLQHKANEAVFSILLASGN